MNCFAQMRKDNRKLLKKLSKKTRKSSKRKRENLTTPLVRVTPVTVNRSLGPTITVQNAEYLPSCLENNQLIKSEIHSETNSTKPIKVVDNSLTIL